MNRPKLLPREQKLALAAGVVIAVWMVVSWLGLPLVERFHQLEQQAMVSRKKLVRLRELASRKPSIEQAYAAYAMYRDDESDESAKTAFLSELEELARAGGLSLSLKPRPIQREGHVSRLGVELDVEATQEALLAFLDRLLSHPALIELDRLRISATVSSERLLRANVLVTKVVVRPAESSLPLKHADGNADPRQ